MSLINQALKLEQQKRHVSDGPIAPMVSRMSRRRHNDKVPLLLFGFTGMGMLLAASVTAIFYFGSDFLQSEKTLASNSTPPHMGVTASAPPVEVSEEKAASEIEDLLSTLSKDQLSTVQMMLLEKEAKSKTEARPKIQPENSKTLTNNEAPTLAETSRIQGIVDSYSVQGIRKSGQNSRVFLNGKIRKIGDTVDIENGIQLIGFTETVLVFETTKGQRFEKTL